MASLRCLLLRVRWCWWSRSLGLCSCIYEITNWKMRPRMVRDSGWVSGRGVGSRRVHASSAVPYSMLLCTCAHVLHMPLPLFLLPHLRLHLLSPEDMWQLPLATVVCSKAITSCDCAGWHVCVCVSDCLCVSQENKHSQEQQWPYFM